MDREDASGSAASEADAEAAGGAYGPYCFSADTPVATPSGERAIGSLKVGGLVEAYNTTTGQTEAEPVQHVWINHDHDLVDVRIQVTNRRRARPPALTRRTNHIHLGYPRPKRYAIGGRSAILLHATARAALTSRHASWPTGSSGVPLRE